MYQITAFFLAACLFLSICGQCQQFGGNPPSLKWRQLKSDEATIIYPPGFSDDAVRIAGIIKSLHIQTAGTIGSTSRKINIVLQNQGTISNGYVGLAPWRSEFMITPLPNSLQLGSIPWLDLLAIHEYRHIQQYQNFRKGFSKLAYLFAGEQGQALANAAALPNWFWEGDAVYQETIASQQGRGRLPSFFAEFRSLWQADRQFSYMKLRNGSFRHLVPDHYTLGYILIAKGREKYGEAIWRKVTQDAIRFRYPIYPFQSAWKRHADQRFSTFAKAALKDFEKTSFPISTIPEKPLTATSERYVTDYSFPYPAGNDSIVIYKKTGKQIPGFYLLQPHKESRIAVRDISINDQFSFRKGLIVYTSYIPDIRWGWRNFSDITLLDTRNGSSRRISQKGKWFSPDLSNDLQTIAAVDVPPSGKSAIAILDTDSGTIRFTYADDRYFFTYPRFSADDRSIFSPVRTDDGSMSILKIDINSGKAALILPLTRQAIAFPYVQGDSLFFTAARKGADRLFCWNDRTQTLSEILARSAGVQQGIPIKDSIIFTGLTAWGNRLFTAKPQAKNISIQEWQDDDAGMYLNSMLQQDALIADTLIFAPEPADQPYKKSTRLINIHSWRPSYAQPDWSFTLYGENVLNTFQSSFSYLFNENERYHQWSAEGAFAAWYPWIIAGTSYTTNRNTTLPSGNTLHWNEWNGKLGLRIPFNLTKGKTFNRLTLGMSWNTLQTYYREKNLRNDFNLQFLDNQLSWAVFSQQAQQHIFPRWGFSTGIRQRGSLMQNEARQLLAAASFYLPGLLANHNLVMNLAFQSRDTANFYTFSNNFPLARGYANVNFPRMWKLGVNYHLPIVYPDKGIGNLVYLLRVRANLFYDLGYVKSLRTSRTWRLSSAGAELFFDTKWWNQQEFSMGIRYARLLDKGPYPNAPAPNTFTFILPLDALLQ